MDDVAGCDENIKSKNAGIYKIFDEKTGKFYIGSAVNLSNRWRQHKYRLDKSNHFNSQLQAIWNTDKRRIKCIVLSELAGLSVAQRLEVEQRHLDEAMVGKNRKCMNVLTVAGSPQGRKRTDATKKAMSESQKGRVFSEETKKKMRDAKIGIKLSGEHKKSLSNARKGKNINRPTGIYNKDRRSLSSDELKNLRKLRDDGMSWRDLSGVSKMAIAACRRAILGITYKDVQ